MVDLNQYHYSAVWSENDQAYIGRVKEFSSLASHGNTEAEAIKQIREVVEFVVLDLQKNQEPIPEPQGE